MRGMVVVKLPIKTETFGNAIMLVSLFLAVCEHTQLKHNHSTRSGRY